MVTFLIILAGLVLFNFVLLRLSMQSVGTDKKQLKTQKANKGLVSNQTLEQSESSKISTAA